MHMSEWTVEVIRSAYAVDRDQRQWLTHLATALAKSVTGADTWLACGFQVHERGPQPTVFASSAPALALINPLLDICQSTSPELREAFANRAGGFGSVRSWGLFGVAEIYKHLRAQGWEDCFFVFVRCTDRTGCAFFFPCQFQPRTNQSRRWRRVLPHIATGWLFRRPGEYLARAEEQARSAAADGRSKPDEEADEAEFHDDPVHSARSWQQLAVGADIALGQVVARERVEQIWRQVFQGNWARIAHFARDGRRYVLLRRLSPEHGRALTLTSRERRTIELASSVEFPDLRDIAREMNCKESTAATHLARALKKLGIRSRAELIALMIGGPSG